MVAATGFIAATCVFFIYIPTDAHTGGSHKELRLCADSDYGINLETGEVIEPSEDVCNSAVVTDCPQKVYVVLAFQ